MSKLNKCLYLINLLQRRGPMSLEVIIGYVPTFITVRVEMARIVKYLVEQYK